MKCPNCGSDKYLPGISESGRYSYCPNCTHTERSYASYFQRQKGVRKNERALRRKERKRGVLLYDKLREASRSRGEEDK